MPKKNDKNSAEELVIQYLKKNKNLLLDYPELLDVLNFPNQIKGSGKIIDLSAYRSKKIKNDYDQIKKQMSEILKAGSSNRASQKRVLKTSLKVSLLYFSASGFISGSSEYIPSTLVPFNITSASISIALREAAESVVKKGFPVPAPKITILPFSKCLTARLLINGSAISFISIDD